MLRRNRVHVAGGVEVALGVVEGAVGDAFFGVCAVPRFAEVLCAAVDAAQRGFGGARLVRNRDGGRVEVVLRWARGGQRGGG